MKLLDPSYWLILSYRISSCLKKSRLLSPLNLIIKFFQQVIFSSYISPTAVIDRSVYFPHPVGIVIGSNAVISKDVWIYQHVTIGSHGKKGYDKEYPSIGPGVTIYAGSVVVGGVEIGADSIIGALVFINFSCAANSTIIGSSKGRVI